MRKMYIMSFMILSLCLVVETSHYLSGYFPAIEGGINKKGRSVGLRKRADQSLPMIEWLPDGAFAQVQFEGERWLYIDYKNQKYAIPKKHFSLGYSNLYGLFVVPTNKYQRYNDWITRHIGWFHVCLIFSMFLWLIVRRKRKSEAVKQIIRNTPTIQPTPSVKPERRRSEIYRPAPVASQIDHQKDDIRQNLINELFKSKAFHEALNTEYRGKIEEMEIAANKMRKEYEKKKESAKILGVDLDSTQLPALVKGRLFEIFAAKIWDADSRATIQSWTPDKGIQEGIHIKSNGEPDFLLELNMHAEIQLVSIECKYRSIYTPQDTSKKLIQWIKYYQFMRYKEYEKASGRKVYMLLGANGDPRSPDYLYLAPISELKKKSLFDERENFKSYYASPEALEPFRVADLTMIDTLFGYLGN